jgi:DNA uptake protein ComE-like DNA-binding protein
MDVAWGTRWMHQVDTEKVMLVINTASDEDLIKIAAAYEGAKEQLLKDVDKYLPGYYERVRLHKVLKGLDGDNLHLFTAQVGRDAVASPNGAFVSGGVRDANTRRILESRYGKNGQAAADLISMFRGGGDLSSWNERYGKKDSRIDSGKIKTIVEWFTEKPITEVLKSISERNRGSAHLDKMERWLVGFDADRSLDVIEQATGHQPVAIEATYATTSSLGVTQGVPDKIYEVNPDRIIELLNDLTQDQKQELLKVGRPRLQAIINHDSALLLDSTWTSPSGPTPLIELLTLGLPEETRTGTLAIIKHVTRNESLPDGLGVTMSEIDQGFRSVFGSNLSEWLAAVRANGEAVRRINAALSPEN